MTPNTVLIEALKGTVALALFNVLIGRYLQRQNISTEAYLSVWLTEMAVLAWFLVWIRRAQGVVIIWPKDRFGWEILLLCGALYFIGDYQLMRAYSIKLVETAEIMVKSRASLIMPIYGLAAVFVCVIEAVWNRRAPNPWVMLAALAAFFAALCVAKSRE